MAILQQKNLEEYRQVFAEELASEEVALGKPITDEMLTKAIYKKLSGKADIDYYSFYSAFNPNGSFANIDTYRLDNQIDENLNDKEVIQQAYKELSSVGNVRFKDFVNVFAPKPFDKEKYLDDLTYNFDIPILPDVDYSIEEIALMNDVNPNTDVSMKEIGFAQSLARDETNEGIVTKQILNEYFGTDVPLRLGPETERLEFLNPESGKYEFVNPVGIDSGDLAKFGGYSIFVIPEILATTFAAGTTGPTGAVITSAATSALLETARLAAGHAMYGINKTEEGFINKFQDYLRKEGKDIAVLNAALTTTGYSVPKLYNIFKNFKFQGKLNVADFGGKIKNAEQADKLVTKINDRLATLGYEKELKFSLGQAANDDLFLALQHAYETNPKYGVKATIDKFTEEQAKALNTYFKLITDGFNYKNLTGKDAIGADQVGKLIQNTIIKRLDPRQKVLTNALEKSEKNLTNAIIKFPNGGKKEAGKEIRGVVDDLYQAFEQEYTNKYKALFKIGGNRSVGTDKILSAVESLNDRQKNTLFKKYPEIKTFFKIPEGDKIGVNELKNTLSDLRRFDRQITKGQIPIEGAPVEGAVSKLIGAIKEQLKDLGEEDVWYREFLKLDKGYAKNKQLYKGVISKLFEVKDGVLKVADENVFEQTFKKGAGQERKIDQIYDLLKKRPNLIQTYKEQILGSYKEAVDPSNSGKINLVAHQKFLNDYEYALSKFFGGKKGLKEIENIGDLSKTVKATGDKYNKIMKQLGTSTKGRLESMDPDKIYAYVYNNKSPTTLNKVLSIIKSDENLLLAFQDEARDQLQKAITTNRGNLSFDNMANYLKNNEKILTRTFDKTFVNDLKNIKDALEITTRKSIQKTTGRTETALNDIIRARLGQFTVAGRTFTALKKIVRADVDKQLAEIIVDPNRLKELLALKNKKFKKDGYFTKAGIEAVKRLFGYNIFDERMFEDDEYTPTMIDLIDKDLISKNVKEAEETLKLAQNTELDNRFNQAILPSGSVPPPQAVNTSLLAQAPNNTGIMKNLSSTERALLSPSEQEIAMRT